MSSLIFEGLTLQEATEMAHSLGYSKVEIVITRSPKDSSPIEESLLRVVKVSYATGDKPLVFTVAPNLLERGFVPESKLPTPSC